ncbi:MAG: bifunctional folylpolyglutamate synthase/dihydrofolate synthase [Pacificimonas sp.]|jgi:dihydrofolate synthase/folylpolyglutamate synthase|nr:bifunctional folylpolyglutamate synthase/dihydrofolate synthase [Pacificimonas sp.]
MGPPIRGDGARSDNPALDALLTRAQALHPKKIDLTLGRLERVLAALGDPHHAVPPTFHVAGTNGKGSVCAFLRAALEAGGKRVHVYTSPHLVRFNERIRLGGTLISDEALIDTLGRVMTANGNAPLTFFELTTAAAFLAFAEDPADALVLEVGLGGRYDATNVIPAGRVAACGLAHISRDHEQFLGSDVVGIAAEKAGIAKTGVPLVGSQHAPALRRRIAEVAAAAGADYLPRGDAWDAVAADTGIAYHDSKGELALALPELPGRHQQDNAALATAMLRHQSALSVSKHALEAAPRRADWPARLQHLETGKLADLCPPGAALFLDGGHNPGAGEAIGQFLERRQREGGQPVTVIAGMIEGKDHAGFLSGFAPYVQHLIAVPIPGYAFAPPAAVAAAAKSLGLSSSTADSPKTALKALRRDGEPPLILICGSLYLAGQVLAANGTPPV